MFFSLFPSQPAAKLQFCLPMMKQAAPASTNLPNSWSGGSPQRRSNAGGGTAAAPLLQATGRKVSSKNFSLLGMSIAKYSLYAKILLIPGVTYTGNV